MTDEELINKANETPYIDWSIIDEFIKEAEALETKHILKRIQLRKFREEEYHNGDL